MTYFCFLVVNILGNPDVPGLLGSVDADVTSVSAVGSRKLWIAFKMTWSLSPTIGRQVADAGSVSCSLTQYS